MMFTAGLDLGEEVDFTALSVVQAEEGDASEELGTGSLGAFESTPKMGVVHLERYRHVLYPEIVRRVVQRLMRPPLWGRVELVVDATGVGRGVADMFAYLSIPFRGVVITGGDAESTSGGWATDKEGNEVWTPVYHRVPKKTLVAASILPFQQEALKVAPRLDLAETLKNEMVGFRWKQNPKTGHETVQHREGEHDDLILSVSLACWSILRFSGAGSDGVNENLSMTVGNSIFRGDRAEDVAAMATLPRDLDDWTRAGGGW